VAEPLPGVFDYRTFVRVKVEIGRCEGVCEAGREGVR
jgi:hypothetical protein